jgi:hypothetical protein
LLRHNHFEDQRKLLRHCEASREIVTGDIRDWIPINDGSDQQLTRAQVSESWFLPLLLVFGFAALHIRFFCGRWIGFAASKGRMRPIQAQFAGLIPKVGDPP